MTMTKMFFIVPAYTFMIFAIATAVAEKDEPWCVAEDRGKVVPEFRADAALIYWRTTTDDNDGKYGDASWLLDEELNITTCLIDSPMPADVWGDEDMDTLGHEALHCFTGDFHGRD